MKPRTQSGTSRASTIERSSAPAAHEHARHPRAQPHFTAALGQPRGHRVRQALRPALRYAVAAGRGRHREHVAERRAEPVVGANVDVQAEARHHPARRLALEQTRREAARAAREHRADLNQVADAEPDERAEARERPEQHIQELALAARVCAREPAERVRVASAAERRAVERVAARDAREAAVDGRVAALVAGVPPLDARADEVQLPEGRAARAEREEAAADVVMKAGQRQLLGAERAARAPRVRLDDEHAVPAPREHRGGHEAVRPRANHDHVRIDRRTSGRAV
jgi:hypothetical protein